MTIATLAPIAPVTVAPTRTRYGVLALLCGLSMITYFDRVCFASAASNIANELGLRGKEELKWAHTAFAIAYGLFEFPAGWLGDRWGPRGTLLRIVVWWSVFTALTGLIGITIASVTLGGLTSLVIVRFLFGAGEAGAYPNIARAIHNWFPAQQWEMAQGYIWMSGRIAGGITPLVCAILINGTAYFGPLVTWRGMFFVFGGFGLAWCAIFAWCFCDRPSDHSFVNAEELVLIGSTWRPHNHDGLPVRAMLTNRSLWAICLMYSLITYGWFFNISYLPGYLKDRFDVADGNLLGAVYTGAPLWIGAFGCVMGGVLVNALTLWLGDRRRARQVIGCTTMLICALTWWGVYRAASLHEFCLLVSLAAFCVDLTLGAAWATCLDLGGKHAAVTAACMNTAGTAGAAFAAWLTGSIVEYYVAAHSRTNPAHIFSSNEKLIASLAGYQAVFLTYAAVYLVAALCWCFINSAQSFDSDGPA